MATSPALMIRLLPESITCNGGSVKNKSKLVSGDLDRDTFLAFFCNSEEETRGAAARRRRGPRAEGRPSPQSRV